MKVSNNTVVSFSEEETKIVETFINLYSMVASASDGDLTIEDFYESILDYGEFIDWDGSGKDLRFRLSREEFSYEIVIIESEKEYE